MKITNKSILKKLYYPPENSYKGQNGKLTIIGGSRLFHGASLWALKTASRIVDMVFYSTVKENEQLAQELKTKLYDFISVPRDEIENYIDESDAVLIGPGLERNYKQKCNNKNFQVEDWENSYQITKYFLEKFPDKKWIIDAGSLQMMKAEWLKKLDKVIITPHYKEFSKLFGNQKVNQQSAINDQQSKVSYFAKKFNCIIVLKGPKDIVCSPDKCLINQTGNQGMTKGGTGDVLAGLIAGLACKNDLFLAGAAGVYINGLAGDSLYKKVGPYFNASDLCDEIPKVLFKL